MMMALGLFVFSLETAAYQEFQRQTEWRHASTSRVGTNPALQFLGRGDDTISLPGLIVPELAGTKLSLDALRYMADTGKAWILVEGTGRVYGMWVIENLQETKTLFFSDGTPRRIEFVLDLKRLDDGRTDLLGSLGNVATDVINILI